MTRIHHAGPNAKKKHNPTIAKLRHGTSGMNERPAKTFSGVKSSKKKNGNETANKMTA